VEAEREFQTTLVVESKRLAVITNNVVVEVVNLDEKVKDIEVKLVSTIIDLGKMEQELSSSKKWE
jgi:peroxiredoxin